MAQKENKKPIANGEYKSEKQLARQELRRKEAKGRAAKRVLIPVIAVIVAIALIVGGAFAAFNAVMDGGNLLRSRIAMQSKNYKITNAMMSFYVYDEYYTYVGSDDEAATKGIDAKKSLKKQDCALYTSGTWFDYFLALAETDAETILTNLEAAKIDGLDTLSAEETAEIDALVKETKLENYGRGLTADDVKQAMTYRAISDNYEAAMKEKVAATIDVGDGAEKSVDAADKDALAAFGDVGKYAADNFDAYSQYEYVKYAVTYKVETEEEEEEEETEEEESGLRSRDEAKAIADAIIAALGENVTRASFEKAVSDALGEETDIFVTVGTASTSDNDIATFASSEESVAGTAYTKDGEAFEDTSAGTFTVYALLSKPHPKTGRTAHYFVIDILASTEEAADNAEEDEVAAVEEQNEKAVARAKEINDEIVAAAEGKFAKDELDAIVKKYAEETLVTVTLNEASSATYATLSTTVSPWVFGEDLDYPRTAGDTKLINEYDQYDIVVFAEYGTDAEWYTSAYNTVLENKATAHFDDVTDKVNVVARPYNMEKIPARK